MTDETRTGWSQWATGNIGARALRGVIEHPGPDTGRALRVLAGQGRP